MTGGSYAKAKAQAGGAMIRDGEMSDGIENADLLSFS